MMSFPTTEMKSDDWKELYWCQSNTNPDLSIGTELTVMKFLSSGKIGYGKYRLDDELKGSKNYIKSKRVGYVRQYYAESENGNVTINEAQTWVDEQTAKYEDEHPSLVPKGKDISFEVGFRSSRDTGEGSTDLMVLYDDRIFLEKNGSRPVHNYHPYDSSIYYSCGSLERDWYSDTYKLKKLLQVEEDFKTLLEKSPEELPPSWTYDIGLL